LLDIRQLRVVDAIIRTGTVTKAAEQLFVTQPAVSHALKEMESKLGVSLFRREGRRMAPTVEGERLAETARLVIDEVGRAEYDLGRYKTGYRGVLHVATGCYTCYHWLPRIINEFAEAFPDVDLQIVPEVTRHPVAALKDGRLDLAIIETEEADDDDLDVQVLFEDELLAVMQLGHPLASRPYLTAVDFANETLLVHNNNPEGVFYDEVLGPAGVHPERMFALQLTEALVESARSGLGVAVLPEWVVAPHVETGRVSTVRVTEKGLFRTWSLATLKDRESVPVRELKRMLSQDALNAAQCCAVVG
jgi:LysR family transcriptional regulator for metE and metH